MTSAFLWGALSGSAVFIGAIMAIFLPMKKSINSYIMAFGTGVLIGAASYELLQESVKEGGMLSTALGFTVGAATFTVFDLLLARKGGLNRKRSSPQYTNSSGLAIFGGTLMDAIPESIMIGASLIEQNQVSPLLVMSIFISNLPEGISGTTGLIKNSFSHKKVVLLWLSVVLISAISSLGGFMFLQQASSYTMSFIAAFAGGGIIAMVASTMLPEAFEQGGPVTGFITSLGLLTSVVLDYFSY